MSVIDQAFVKAYSRRTGTGGVAATSPGSDAALPADLSIHPDAATAATIWFDPGQSLDRRDPVEPTSELAPAWHPQAARSPVEPAPSEPRCDPFVAACEVDTFEFTLTIGRLFSDPRQVRSIAESLDRVVAEGLQTLLITSSRRGAGRTSVATGIAVTAASAGLRVALVDATLATTPPKSAVADVLNLEVERGWLDVIRQGSSVAEIAIHSIEDQLTVIPAGRGPLVATPTADEFACLLGPLRQAFDLVVIDAPPHDDAVIEALTSAAASQKPLIDAAVVVEDVRDAERAATVEILDSFASQGIIDLGLVENFV